MTKLNFLKTRVMITSITGIATWCLLIYNHFHGGVPSHHFLADEKMPAVSNLWGALLLPLLSWVLLYRAKIRIEQNNEGSSKLTRERIHVLQRFTASIAFGIILSSFFSFGNTDVPGYMLISVLLLALFVPVYRAECLLGFVIGMTFTFGAVIPTLVGSVLAILCAMLYLGVRPAITYLAAKAGIPLSRRADETRI